jgi:hypothetical protein
MVIRAERTDEGCRDKSLSSEEPSKAGGSLQAEYQVRTRLRRAESEPGGGGDSPCHAEE